MEKRDLSVIITARNEEFLARTVEDVLAKKRLNTEVIVICDGNWPNPQIKDHPDLVMIYHQESIGQRAAINEAARVSQARYIMKLDAHCIVSEGFDEVLVRDGDKLGRETTQVPRMYNLHAFDWRCKKCGNRWYQGPSPKFCRLPGENSTRNLACDSQEFERVMVWEPRWNRQSDTYRFDKNLHFYYWGEWGERPQNKETDIVETMSLLGACFFMNRERYWELGGSDEAHGSWGQQGTEIACMTWLSGGRLVTNRKCWFSHMFRTQGGDFGFPYELGGNQVEHARKYSQKKWREGKWKHAQHNLQWLIDKFAPIPDWHDKRLGMAGEKGIIFYTDNQLSLKIAKRVQKQLLIAAPMLPIVSVSLKPMGFPYNHGKNVKFPLERGWITMNKQILAGLKEIKTKYVFFCEHDVLYHPSHFEFTPKRDDVYYYNVNVWRLRATDGLAVHVNDCRQLSGLVCNRELAIKHYEKRLKMLEAGVSVRLIGFEPGTHHRDERVDDLKSEPYQATLPNVDIRTGVNATASRWRPEDFRNKRFTEGWTETQDIPGWGKMADFL